MRKLATIFTSTFALLFLSVAPAMAHVVVKPNQVGIAAYQTFTIGVPNERDVPAVGLRLLVPEGMKSVSPNVKSGWTINVKKTGEGEDAVVSEITWTGGSIPAGQRDDFLFSAQAPAAATTISWKAYQTYQDGTIVSWDQTPDAKITDAQREEMEKKNQGPFSQTQIVNDLASSATGHHDTGTTLNSQEEEGHERKMQLITLMSGASLGLSVVALAIAKKK